MKRKNNWLKRIDFLFWGIVLGIIFFFPWQRIAFLILILLLSGRHVFRQKTEKEAFITGLIFDLAWGNHLGESALIFLTMIIVLSLFKKEFSFSRGGSELKIPER